MTGLIAAFTLLLSTSTAPTAVAATGAAKDQAQPLQVEWRTRPDGEQVPMLHPATPEPRHISAVPLNVTVTADAGSVVTYNSHGGTKTITVTVKDGTNPVSGIAVTNEQNNIVAQTNTNGVALLSVDSGQKGAWRVTVTQNGVNSYGWFAVADTTVDAVVNLVLTNPDGLVIQGNGAQFIGATASGSKFASLKWDESHAWLVLPAGKDRLVGSAYLDIDHFQQVMVFQDETLTAAGSTGTINDVLLDGMSTVAVTVKAPVNSPVTRVTAEVAPNDDYDYAVVDQGIAADTSRNATFFVTPGNYSVRYYSSEPQMALWETKDLTEGTVLQPEPATLASMTLSTEPTSDSEAIFVGQEQRVVAFMHAGTALVTPGQLNMILVEAEMADPDTTDWFDYAYYIGNRGKFDLTGGGEQVFNMPLLPVPEVLPQEATAGTRNWVEIAYRNAAQDELAYVHRLVWNGFDYVSAPIDATVTMQNQAGQSIPVSGTHSLYGFSWDTPATPADQVYRYHGVWSLGPALPGAQIDGAVAVGKPILAWTDPPAIPAHTDTDVTVNVRRYDNSPVTGATVALNGTTVVTDKYGEATFTAMNVLSAQPILVNGSPQGVLSVLGGVASVTVGAPMVVEPGAVVDVPIQVNNAPGLYGAQVELTVDPQVFTVTSVTRGNLFADHTLYEVNPGADAAGHVTYAATLVGNAPAVSGDGTLVTLRLTTVAPVGKQVDFASALRVKLSTAAATPIPEVATAPITTVGYQITGHMASAFGPLGDGWVDVYDDVTGDYLDGVFPDKAGNFWLIAPQEDGQYLLAVEGDGFLPGASVFTVTGGVPSISTVGNVVLVYGDHDEDGAVTAADLQDLADSHYGDSMYPGRDVDIIQNGMGPYRYDLQDLYQAAHNIGAAADPAVAHGWLIGWVTDTAGHPLADATVTVTPTAPPADAGYLAVHQTKADSNGFYALPLPVGYYKVTFEAAGHETMTGEDEIGYLFDQDEFDAQLPAQVITLTTPLTLTVSWSGTGDLDLEGTIPGSVDDVHSYTEFDNRTNSQTAYPWVVGGGDVTSTDGSETLTIYKFIPGETFDLWNHASWASLPAGSSVTVTLKEGDTVKETWTVPHTYTYNNVWGLFTLQQGTDGNWMTALYADPYAGYLTAGVTAKPAPKALRSKH